MKKLAGAHLAVALIALLFFSAALLVESSAWARAGGGGSFGSRGSRSFSAPSMPSSPGSSPFSSPGFSSPSRPSGQPSYGGNYSRSPFLQGMAGGLAGGFLGNLLFGGMGHAAPMGGMGGGGVGLLDILIIGGLLYLFWKFMRRKQEQATSSYYEDSNPQRMDDQYSLPNYPSGGSYGSASGYDQVQRGIQQIRQFDPTFSEDGFKETAQDLFFRIQAGWMNRSLEGIEPMLTPEMAGFFESQFSRMRQQGRINRLENIAIRKVEPTEAWQESGKDYITVLFTANLLDYSVDDKTGQVVEGDKLNPVKFQEFWTFTRDIGSPAWRLSAINQVDQPAAAFH